MLRTSHLKLACLLALLTALPTPADAAETAADNRGRIYGTIETISGKSYTGILRWGNEEAFWDDHFNGSKRDQPATGDLPRHYRKHRRTITVFGLEIPGSWDDDWEQRQLMVRFGDLAEIRPHGDDRAELVFKNGDRLKIEGGSNDFGAEITVTDDTLGEVSVEWDRIESIRFAATPAAARVEGRRLRAKVHTSVGDFSGWLAWDSQEATTLDKLDGESDDGEVSISMGKIRAIERRSRQSSRVELTDGRTLEMSDSNDVDSSIRGILVEDPRFGKVEVSWDVFVRADIEAASDTGHGYDDYPALAPIHARVTTEDGDIREGTIAFDLDEQYGWEMLNGSQDDVEYSIPFARIQKIRPLGSRRSEVTLHNGEKLTLEGQTDVDDSNGGVAFLDKKGDEAFLPWDEVETIEFR